MDIYSNFPHCYPVPAPLSTKSTLAPSRPETNERFTDIVIPAETIVSLFQLDTQMFIFFNALAKWSKILIFKMDIFTNVLRKIFVKGSMHLIYEFK